MERLKVWFAETRPRFLTLTLATSLVALGALVADGVRMDWINYAIALLGALLAHVSVNVLNDYFDYVSGIDLKTRRTPFSGGSGILPSGLLSPREVYYFGLICLLADIPIALYFFTKVGWGILAIAAAGAFFIYAYTPLLTKGGLAEFSAGAGFALMELGFYYVQTGSLSSTALASAVLTGLVVTNLLLLNEFPDVEADKEAGRRHIPALLGVKGASRVFALVYAAFYALALFFTASGALPPTSLLCLFTVPLCVTTCVGAAKYCSDIQRLVPYMAKNVALTHLSLLSLAIGLALAPLL